MSWMFGPVYTLYTKYTVFWHYPRSSYMLDIIIETCLFQLLWYITVDFDMVCQEDNWKLDKTNIVPCFDSTKLGTFHLIY